MTDRPFIEAAGLWEKTGRNGKYLTGRWGNLRVFVFRNDQRGNDRAPTHRLVFSEERKQEEQSTGQSSQQGGAVMNDDVPFGPDR